MEDAVQSGNARKLAELMKQDPGFNVNMRLDDDGWALLHFACAENYRSVVIPLLLAHPDIDVNVKGRYAQTPFYYACNGYTSCVHEMLKDSRVKVNETDDDGHTPLYLAAWSGRLETIKWWIVSGREMDLGTPGDVGKTDAIGVAKEWGHAKVVTLLERFKENPGGTKHVMRVDLGWYGALAAEIFALVVFVSDELLQIKDTMNTTPAARFFKIARSLPLELQIVLCFRQVGSAKEIIPGKESEVAFKELARRI